MAIGTHRLDIFKKKISLLWSQLTYFLLQGKRTAHNVYQHPVARSPEGLLSQRPDIRGNGNRGGVAPICSRHRRHNVHH